MYAYIKGKISEINPTNIVIDNNGIGYEITVANPYEYQLNEEKQIYISQQVREDSNTLYGFLTKEQKKVFLLLLKVKGVGPKSALAILAGATSEEIISAIEKQDVNYLTKFPGIGKTESLANLYIKDALLALEALGYSKKELAKIESKLAKFEFSAVDDYVKQGLKLLFGN